VRPARIGALGAWIVVLTGAGPALAQVTSDVPAGLPASIVDLRTVEGVELLGAEWRYHDVHIVETDHRLPGPDLRPSGPPSRTHDIEPQASARDFDDSAWEVLDPTSLEARRGNGRLSFNWYRIRVRIPERIGSFDPTGSTAVFEIVVDDYAEIWVDGVLPVVLGQSGGPLVRGWNAPNRVVLGHDVRPGQEFQLAVFGMNGPISSPPGNYIWIRSATVEFHPADGIGRFQAVEADIRRLDPKLDEVLAPEARVERVATGFRFTEGPVWSPDGYLLFSDPNANTIYRWTPDGQVLVYRTKSGYTGVDIGEYGQPGSNGLTLDDDGRLVIAEHGNRRISRLERNGLLTVLVDRYRGMRLNSPNDLVHRSDGALYFTDPPFGLPRFGEDPRKELPFNGVFLWRDGELTPLVDDLEGPNGLAFSPDERFLYVGNWDLRRKVVMRYGVRADGTLDEGEVFFDLTDAPGEEAIDGVKVDARGNVYVSGPGGMWIVSPAGKPLGAVLPPELPANFAFGDADGRTLYMTARTGLYRLRLRVPGIHPEPAIP
jgi:gluconolactonase